MRLWDKLSGQFRSGHGYVDCVNVCEVEGWARDRSRPDAPVVVDAFSGSQLVASAVADRYREDLEQAGVGSGRHGFSLQLPPALVFGDHPVISVRVRDHDVALSFQNKTEIPVKTVPIRYVASDIVNNCNLRCPFCVVDYSIVKKTELMTEETFRSLLRLLPVVPVDGFWLSCLHEPTLHPKLNQFIDLIPRAERNKFWYTTNLAKPMEDRTFEHWAESGLHHINVSFDTLDAELYAVLRKFGRLEIFLDNVERMAAIFRKHREAPKIRYITVVFRSTLGEIPEIVRQSHERYHAHENEVRYIYNMAHITDDFRREHFLPKDEWPALSERLRSLAYRHLVVCPPDDEPEDLPSVPANYFDCAGPGHVTAPPVLKPPFELRARPNGALMMVGQELSLPLNINQLEDPVAYFGSMARTGIVPGS